MKSTLETDRQLILAWDKAESMADVMEALGWTYNQVRNRAYRLRSDGVVLKYLGCGPRKTEGLEELIALSKNLADERQTDKYRKAN